MVVWHRVVDVVTARAGHMVAALVLAAGCLAVPVAGSAASAPAASLPPDFERQLRQLLRDNPDIVLDVLSENSETVLDIVQQGSDHRRRQALLRQWQADMQEPKNVTLEGRPARGPQDAPVTLIAFSDFTCGYCQQAAVTVENLLNRYPGKIRFVFKQDPTSDLGRLASRWFLAASSQDQDKAWRFYAMLFDQQDKYAADPLAVLRETAAKAGLNPADVEAELAAHAKAIEQIIDVDKTDAQRLGFAGTPYFLVNNLVIRGALPLENFIDAVELALKGK